MRKHGPTNGFVRKLELNKGRVSYFRACSHVENGVSAGLIETFRGEHAVNLIWSGHVLWKRMR